MMAVPADGITLSDKQATTQILLKAGADIHSLNAVRKHLSGIKGGQLAAGSRALCTTLAVSDVVGDDLSVIASGPTVPDASTFHDALAVMRRYADIHHYPPAVVARIMEGVNGHVRETPKPADSRLERATARVIGGRGDAMSGAAALARLRGYRVVRIEDPVVGEARTAARSWLAASMRAANTVDGPACVISSGETTVAVKGPGRGGRNQEFALALAGPLGALHRPAVVASVGTDGLDGPTDAAGATVDSGTLARAASIGLNAPDAFLEQNNAYEFLATLGDLVRTGPTGTNVGDLQILLIN
jgi:hydroxypyruvate reductase